MPLPTIIDHPVSNLSGGVVQIFLGSDRVSLGWKNDDGTAFTWVELLPDGAQDYLILRRNGGVSGPGTRNDLGEIYAWKSDGSGVINP